MTKYDFQEANFLYSMQMGSCLSVKIFVLSFYTDFIEILVGWFEYIELLIQKAQHSYADILAFAARDSIALVSRLT